MDLGHPGWRDSEGWRKPKKVGDTVLGPCGSPTGEGTVLKVRQEDPEDWLVVRFADVLRADRAGNFYLLEG